MRKPVLSPEARLFVVPKMRAYEPLKDIYRDLKERFPNEDVAYKRLRLMRSHLGLGPLQVAKRKNKPLSFIRRSLPPKAKKLAVKLLKRKTLSLEEVLTMVNAKYPNSFTRQQLASLRANLGLGPKQLSRRRKAVSTHNWNDVTGTQDEEDEEDEDWNEDEDEDEDEDWSIEVFSPNSKMSVWRIRYWSRIFPLYVAAASLSDALKVGERYLRVELRIQHALPKVFSTKRMAKFHGYLDYSVIARGE